jgi:nodulation protein E
MSIISSSRRVVLTGVGIVSSLGQDYQTFTQNLMAGLCAIGPLTVFDTTLLQAKNGAEIPTVNHSSLNPKLVNTLDRVSLFACLAAQQAIADSGFDGDRTRTACIVGTGVAGQNTQEENYARLFKEGATRLHPLTIPKLMANAPASQVSMLCGLKGPSFAVASACASANHAIGTAFHMIRHGMADAAMTGGTEACLTFGTLKGWEALRVMSPDVCRPFSRDRQGMSLGEGSAMFMLETLEAAQARGAKIYGEIIGFGQTADAADLTSPDAAGAARAVRAALHEAGLEPTAIDYINAHGTGTTVNDATETQVIKDVFSGHAYKLAISSTKSQTGHALGAAGAIEMAAVLAAFAAQKAPPTVNYLGADPACDLDYVPNTARPMTINTALSNSFAFGGLNAVLALRKI